MGIKSSLTSLRGSTLKVKTLLLGRKFFPLRVDSILKEFFGPLFKNGEKYGDVSTHLTHDNDNENYKIKMQ